MTETSKIGGRHHHQSLHSIGTETGWERSNAATERPREDGDFARTDGDERPTVAHRRRVRGDVTGDTIAGDSVVNRTPMNERYNGDGLHGRDQIYQLQTECRGRTGEGANNKVWHWERVRGHHLQRAKAHGPGEKG